jgi:LacI family transcriptional regulator
MTAAPRTQPRLADIARAAGVSVSAVSMALHEKPGLPAETRQRILSAADELGYRRKTSLQTTPSSRAAARLRTIGLLVKSEPDLPPQANPFYSYIIAGIEEACRRKRINLLYAAVPVDEHNVPLEIPSLLNEKTADGLLLVGAFVNRGLADILNQTTLPLVLVDAYSEFGDYDSVVSDNLLSARQAILHLIERGHRHIGIVGGSPQAYPSILERLRGYEQAIRDRGLSPYYIQSDMDRLSAYRAVTSALKNSPELTAIFGCNDEVTLGAMSAAIDLGKHIPDDISFIGFDDIEQAARAVPPLTTMRVDKSGMGRIAVQLLIDRIEYPASTPVTVALHARLVERASVAWLQSAGM